MSSLIKIPANRKNEQGFTLTELLVTLTILAFVLTILASFLKEGFVSFDRTFAEAETQLEVRHKLEMVKRDIRESKAGVVSGSKYPLADTQNRTLHLLGGASDQPTLITYSFEGNLLYRQITGEEKQPFLSDVVECSFTTDPDIDLVTVQLAVAWTTEQNSQPVRKSYSLKVHPRGKE